MILPPSICTAQVEYVASLLRASLVGETPTKTEPEPILRLHLGTISFVDFSFILITF